MTTSPHPTRKSSAIGINMAGEVFASPLSKVSALTSSSIGTNDFSSSIISSDAGFSLLTGDDDDDNNNEYFVKTKDCPPSSSTSFRRRTKTSSRRRRQRHNNNNNRDQRWSALDRSLFSLSPVQQKHYQQQLLHQQQQHQRQGEPFLKSPPQRRKSEQDISLVQESEWVSPSNNKQQEEQEQEQQEQQQEKQHRRDSQPIMPTRRRADTQDDNVDDLRVDQDEKKFRQLQKELVSESAIAISQELNSPSGKTKFFQLLKPSSSSSPKSSNLLGFDESFSEERYFTSITDDDDDDYDDDDDDGSEMTGKTKYTAIWSKISEITAPSDFDTDFDTDFDDDCSFIDDYTDDDFTFVVDSSESESRDEESSIIPSSSRTITRSSSSSSPVPELDSVSDISPSATISSTDSPTMGKTTTVNKKKVGQEQEHDDSSTSDNYGSPRSVLEYNITKTSPTRTTSSSSAAAASAAFTTAKRPSSALSRMAEKFCHGVRVGTNSHRMKKYENSFIGREAVDWMVQSGMVKTREDAVFLGERFVRELRLFFHCSWDHGFKDGYYVYQFTDFVGCRRNTAADSSSSSPSSGLFGRKTSVMRPSHPNTTTTTTAIDDLQSIGNQFRENVTVMTHRYHFKKYRKTFVGREAVDWLVKSKIVATRKDAVFLGQRMLEELNLFHHVNYYHQFKDAVSWHGSYILSAFVFFVLV